MASASIATELSQHDRAKHGDALHKTQPMRNQVGVRCGESPALPLQAAVGRPGRAQLIDAPRCCSLLRGGLAHLRRHPYWLDEPPTLGCPPVEHRPSYLTDLMEFIEGHRTHGTLTGKATAPEWNGYLLTGGVARVV